MRNIIQTYTDGGARGNPGPAAIGVVIKDEQGTTLRTHAEYIGETTNNQAEYRALIKALELAQEYHPQEVRCFLDSELLVKQMRQEYRVKEPGLQKLFVQAWNAALKFKKITYTHVRRELNTEADAALNKVLDAHAGK